MTQDEDEMSKNNIKKHIVKSVIKGSIANQLDIKQGDEILRINRKKIQDVFDYHYLINDENIIISIRNSNGEEWEGDIEKEYDEDLGIVFYDNLMDDYRSCRNKCIFCFIDQMPPGMRETLYFKDDDARLSFLQGNYITLTNMSEEDIERICLYKLSPINISVHTTNKELRNKMLGNRFAGETLKYLEKFYEANITMNAQIVLCKGHNDKEELAATVTELSRYLPYMQSVSVVPVGLTRYREGLAKLTRFTSEDAKEVIQCIESFQNEFLIKYRTRMIYASDEWYISAGLPFPNAKNYEGYMQIENGVGMVRSMIDEFDECFERLDGDNREKKVSMATGVLFAPVLRELTEKIMLKYPKVFIKVYTIYNNFFGTDITVAGLLTGQDIIAQLKDKKLYDYLLLPSSLLRSGEDMLLDDYSISDIERTLQTRIRIVQSKGTSLIEEILNN